MRLESPPHLIELFATEVVPQELPAAGDVRLEVRASTDSFCGATSCWVQADEMASFACALSQLSGSLQGTAQLRSISPGEFTLSLTAINPRGYVLVCVELAKRIPHRCTFSTKFEVDLPSLAPLLSWCKSPNADA